MSARTFARSGRPKLWKLLLSLEEWKNFPLEVIHLLLSFLPQPPNIFHLDSDKVYLFSQAHLDEGKKWELISTMYPPRYNIASAVVDKCVYVTGGHSYTDSSLVESCDLTGKWTPLTITHKHCESHVAVSCGNFLYLCGGINRFTKDTGIESCEVFNLVTGECSTIPSMVYGRYNHVGAECEGKIYCFGSNYTSCYCMSAPNSRCNCNAAITAEVFDPTEQKWKLIANMPYRRKYAAAVVINLMDTNFIALIGGVTNGDKVRSAFISDIDLYNPANDSWSKTTWKLPEARYDLSAYMVNEGTLLIIGGKDEDGRKFRANESLLFDLTTEKWYPLYLS